MPTKLLRYRSMNDCVGYNFCNMQINFWDSGNVTDFDGTVMQEKALAKRGGKGRVS